MAVSRSRDEDQQLGSTVDGRLHRVRAPHHACRSFTHQSSCELATTGRLHLDPGIDCSATRIGTLLHVYLTDMT